VREAVDVLAREPHALHEVGRALRDVGLRHAVQRERAAEDLGDALARVQRGERVLEDHLHVAAQRPHLAAPGPRDVAPAEGDAPSVGSSSRMIVRDSVVFPQPDSPTRPSVSPERRSKVTSSTACTRAATRLSTPLRMGSAA
jgi:hypothetical protein